MGLDQYLYARRNLPADFDLTAEQRQEFNDTGEVYLGNWEHMPSEAKVPYQRAVELVGIAATADSPHAEIISDDDNARDGFALRVCFGYWRKANHIHAWFVEHVQDGVDECQYAEVSREALLELREACAQVLGASEAQDGLVTDGWTSEDADPDVDLGQGKGMRPMLKEGKWIVDTSTAERLLPTQGGFFFGSTDYDQWYLADLERTIAIADKALALPEDTTIYYRSSW